MHGWVCERTARKERIRAQRARGKASCLPGQRDDSLRPIGKHISFLGALALLFLGGCANSIPDETAIVGTWKASAYGQGDTTVTIKKGDKEALSLDMEFFADGKGWISWNWSWNSNLPSTQKERDAFTYTLDASKNPKWITLQFDDEKKATHGLYSLEGNTLRIAASGGPDAKRPASFSQNDVQVIVLRRTGS
jgi:uncharacterized protein (TIGR03067 family)